MRHPAGLWRAAIPAAALLAASPAAAQIPAGVIGGMAGGLAAGFLSSANTPGEASLYILDSAGIRPDLFRGIALRMGFRELPGKASEPCFEYRTALTWQAHVCFSVYPRVSAKADTLQAAPNLTGEKIAVRPDVIFGRVSIEAKAHDNPGTPLAYWVLSAYLRELRPERPADTSLYMEPERKSLRGYRWRNTLSMGWGTRYAGYRNPFLSQVGIATALGYTFDLATGFLILAGPFVGSNTAARVSMPIVGLAGAALLRAFLFNSGNLQPSFTLLDSDYPMPKALVSKE